MDEMKYGKIDEQPSQNEYSYRDSMISKSIIK